MRLGTRESFAAEVDHFKIGLSILQKQKAANNLDAAGKALLASFEEAVKADKAVQEAAEEVMRSFSR